MFGVILLFMAASALLALIVGCNAQNMGARLGLLDRPDGNRKLHGGAVPLVGGFPVMAAIALSCFVMVYTFWRDQPAYAQSLCWFFISVFAFFLVGVADDHQNLSAKRRLVLFFLFLIFILSVEESFVLHRLVFSNGVVLSLQNFGIFFTLLCMAGLINAVNMADGKNGLVIGLAMIWLVALGIHANFYLWPIIFAMLAALAVTFWFNMQERLFLGDAGSYAISSALALLTIYIYNQYPRELPADQVILLFALPVLDAMRLIVQRLLNGVSPFKGDRNHLHHYLWAAMGWPKGLWVYLLTVMSLLLLGQWFHDYMFWVVGLAVLVYFAMIGLCARIAKGKHHAELAQ